VEEPTEEPEEVQVEVQVEVPPEVPSEVRLKSRWKFRRKRKRWMRSSKKWLLMEKLKRLSLHRRSISSTLQEDAAAPVVLQLQLPLSKPRL